MLNSCVRRVIPLQVSDIALEDYIAVKPKFAVYVPHTAGRYQKRRFRKALCPIVERWDLSNAEHVCHAFALLSMPWQQC